MVLDRNPVPVPAYSQDPGDILPVPQLLSEWIRDEKTSDMEQDTVSFRSAH